MNPDSQDRPGKEPIRAIGTKKTSPRSGREPRPRRCGYNYVNSAMETAPIITINETNIIQVSMYLTVSIMQPFASFAYRAILANCFLHPFVSFPNTQLLSRSRVGSYTLPGLLR